MSPKNIKKILIAGDSILRNIQGWEMKKNLNRNINVYVKPFKAAKVKCMKDYIKSLLNEKPNHVIIHIGTNNIASKTESYDIAKSIMDFG